MLVASKTWSRWQRWRRKISWLILSATGNFQRNLRVKVWSPPTLFGAVRVLQYPTGYAGAVFSLSIEDFEKIVNERYDEANLKVRKRRLFNDRASIPKWAVQ